MKFTKMQGLGNDYVYVNCFKEKIDNPSALALKISDRHFGVGSDGLIMINPSDKADFEMEMYNADGSRGEMCGNGIRCVAKYVYDYGLTDRTNISVETLGGIKYLDLTVENGKVRLVKVDMGKPVLEPAKIPVVAEGDKGLKCGVVSQAAVHLPVVPGVVAMAGGLEQRSYVDGITAKGADVGNPLVKLLKAVYGFCAVIVFWGSRHPQGIHVVKYPFFIPSAHAAVSSCINKWQPPGTHRPDAAANSREGLTPPGF